MVAPTPRTGRHLLYSPWSPNRTRTSENYRYSLLTLQTFREDSLLFWGRTGREPFAQAALLVIRPMELSHAGDVSEEL
jgi:hypothetical protein